MPPKKFERFSRKKRTRSSCYKIVKTGVVRRNFAGKKKIFATPTVRLNRRFSKSGFFTWGVKVFLLACEKDQKKKGIDIKVIDPIFSMPEFD